MPPHPTPFFTEQIVRLKELVAEGKYVREIAKTMGWSRENTLSRAKMAGVKIPLDPQYIPKPYEHLYNTLAASAFRRQVHCDLTFEEFLSFIQEEAKCVYCSMSVSWSPHQRGSKSYNLDRVDNSLGYTKSNLVVCCYLCNLTRSNTYSHEEFLVIGPAIAKVATARLQLAA